MSNYQIPIPKVLSDGVHKMLGGEVTIRCGDDGCIIIDRIEIAQGLRKTGIATKIIKALADLAAAHGIELIACICPDNKDRAITEGLISAFTKAGFKAYEDDGEVYPLDVIFNAERRVFQNDDIYALVKNRSLKQN